MNPIAFLTGGNVSRLVATLLVGISLGGAATWRVQEWRWDANTLKAENTRLQIAKDAEHENRNIEAARQRNVIDAQNAAAVRRSRDLADRDSARAVADGLRGDIDAITRGLPSLTDRAVREYAAAANAVLGDCSRAVEDMAGKAQGHAGDTLTLQQSWPKR